MSLSLIGIHGLNRLKRLRDSSPGGVLSHCAIVSREYRMPCVVGTLMGTAVIQDGMTLTVDGSTGVVRIDSRG